MAVTPPAEELGPGDVELEEALLEVERDVLGGAAPPREAEAPEAPLPEARPPPSRDAYNVERDAAEELALRVAGALDQQYGGLVQRLRSRLREYEGRTQWARKAHDRWRLDRGELEGRLEDLRMENHTLRERAASAASQVRQVTASAAAAAGKYTVIGGGKQRSVNERLQQEGQMELGYDMDMPNMDEDGAAFNFVAKRGLMTRLRASLCRCLQRMTPFSRDIHFLRSQYGSSCGNFFRFMRLLVFLSLVILLLHLPLLIFRAMEGIDTLTGPRCGSSLFPIPCKLMYSGFYKAGANGERDLWLATRYLLSTAISALALLGLALVRWAQGEVELQAERLTEELQPRPWSKLVLALWDFRLRNDADQRAWAQSLENRLLALHDQEKEAARAGSRTRCQRYVMHAIRAVGLLVNLALIGGAGVLIALAMANKPVLAAKLEAALQAVGLGGFGNQVGELAPNFVVSGIGMVLPSLTKLIISYEYWAPMVEAQQNLWRLYLGKVLSLAFFLLLNIELLVGKPFYGEQALVKHDTSRYTCVEDQAGANLASLVVTEFLLGLFLKPVSALISEYVTYRLLRPCGPSCGYDGAFQKPPFPIAECAVDIIYFESLLWAAAVLAPPLVILAPAALLFHFKWLQFALRRLSSRPFVAETSALGVAVLRLLCTSCLLFAALAYGLATTTLAHGAGCGPFESGQAPALALARLELPGWVAVDWLLKAMSGHPWLPLGVAVAVAAVAVLRWRGGVRVHREALNELQLSSQRHVESLEQELWRLERQSEHLKRRLAWHEQRRRSA